MCYSQRLSCTHHHLTLSNVYEDKQNANVNNNLRPFSAVRIADIPSKASLSRHHMLNAYTSLFLASAALLKRLYSYIFTAINLKE